MVVDVRMDDDEVARYWRPSTYVRPGVKAAIVLAAAITIALVQLTFTVMRRYFPYEPYSGSLDPLWLAGCGLVVVTTLLVLAVAGLRDTSWWARAAVVLAGTWLALIGVAGIAWYQLTCTAGDFWCVGVPGLVDRLPLHWYALAAGAIAIVAAAIGARRRGPPLWVRGLAVFGLANLVALGCWLPLAGVIADRIGSPALAPADLARAHVALVLVPPALVALAVAVVVALAARRHRPLARPVVIGGQLALGLALVAAVGAMNSDRMRAIELYENYVHALAGAALFTLCSLLGLAVAHARALRAARSDAGRAPPWVQTGRVESAGPAAHLIYQGWLGGLTTRAGAFTLRTPSAVLHVPAGAHVVAPIASWSTGAAVGEALPIVADGDLVTVSGFVAPPADGPFRGGGAPIAGARGLVITVERRPDDRVRRDLVLLLWRPCLLFLIACTLAALPGLAADHAPDAASRHSDYTV